MERIDLTKMRLERVNQAKIKNGMLTMSKITEISTCYISLRRMAIPVAPPSKKPLGNKNIFSPILARRIPIKI